jgi:type II secretion system protein N
MPSMSSLPLLYSALGNLRSLRPAWVTSLSADIFTRLKRLSERLLSSRTGWLWYTVACFVFFMIVTFPSDVLLQRLVASVPRESGVHTRYREGNCSWFEGCILHDLTLAGPFLRGTTVQLSHLTLHPSLWGLFVSGQPWPLVFAAEGYNGTISGTLRQVIGGMSAQLALRHLALEQLPLPAPWGQGRVSGSITADGDFLGNPADLYALQGTFTATLTDSGLRAGALNGFPILALQTVQGHLRTSLAAGRLEISELKLSIDGVEASLQGGIILRTPLTRSGLDLQLTTNSTGSPPPSLKALLSLLPASQTSSGERRSAVTGTFVAPVIR